VKHKFRFERFLLLSRRFRAGTSALRRRCSWRSPSESSAYSFTRLLQLAAIEWIRFPLRLLRGAAREKRLYSVCICSVDAATLMMVAFSLSLRPAIATWIPRGEHQWKPESFKVGRLEDFVCASVLCSCGEVLCCIAQWWILRLVFP